MQIVSRHIGYVRDGHNTGIRTENWYLRELLKTETGRFFYKNKNKNNELVEVIDIEDDINFNV